MFKYLIGLSAILFMLNTGCTNYIEEDFNNSNDTTDNNISFSGQLQPLLSSKCSGCHMNGQASGGITMDTYEEIKELGAEGSLLATIKHRDGYVAMPLGSAKLSDAEINTVKQWIYNGMQNN